MVGEIFILMEQNHTPKPSTPMLFTIDRRVHLSRYLRILSIRAQHSIRVLQEHTYLQQNLYFKRSHRLQFISSCVIVTRQGILISLLNVSAGETNQPQRDKYYTAGVSQVDRDLQWLPLAYLLRQFSRNLWALKKFD